MAKIESIYGAYAQASNMQAIIDLSKDKFNSIFWKKYFQWGIPSNSLTYVTAIGRSRIEATASVVDRDAESPLRSRAIVERLNGEVPAIKEKFKMSEKDYRDYLTVQQLSIADSTKKKQLLDLLFSDIKKAGNSVMKRLDVMVLEGLSTGKISISVDNNPDGIVTDDIDLLMPASNKVNASNAWATAGADPIADIDGIIESGRARGITFAKMLMSQSLWLTFKRNAKVQSELKSFFNPGSNAKVTYTLSSVNDYLAENQYPIIEIVNEIAGIEKDGIISNYRPFNETAVSFIPDGGLGMIHNALAIEELQPVAKVSYAKYENALISKWSENDPFAEYTKVELNAFPGFDAIDSIFILKTA